jgi:hypothetical protein
MGILLINVNILLRSLLSAEGLSTHVTCLNGKKCKKYLSIKG